MLPPPYPCHLSPAPPHLAYTYRSRSLEEALVPCCLALSPPHPLTPPSSVCSSRSLEEALVHAFVEARRAAPALLFLPHLDGWWRTAPPPLRACLTQVRGCLLPPPPCVPASCSPHLGLTHLPLSCSYWTISPRACRCCCWPRRTRPQSSWRRSSSHSSSECDQRPGLIQTQPTAGWQ